MAQWWLVKGGRVEVDKRMERKRGASGAEEIYEGAVGCIEEAGGSSADFSVS